MALYNGCVVCPVCQECFTDLQADTLKGAVTISPQTCDDYAKTNRLSPDRRMAQKTVNLCVKSCTWGDVNAVEMESEGNSFSSELCYEQFHLYCSF